MKNETVRKASQATRKTNAEIGGITRGSGATRPNKTTSTNFPAEAAPKSFLNKLGEMQTAEKELTLAIPLLVKAAKSKDLKALLQIHLTETKGHLKTVGQVADSLGEKLNSKSCKPVTQLIAEAVKVIGKRLVTHEQDAALIAVGQKVEQFEIAAYTELCATAKEMNWTHELALLTSILNQEKLASELLAGLARGGAPLQQLVEKASLKKAGAKSS